MTYPRDSRNTMTRIFPQEGTVIGNPFRSSLPVPEVGAKAPQEKWESHCESAVAYLSGEVGETSIIAFGCTGEKIFRCASGTHRSQCDNRKE